MLCRRRPPLLHVFRLNTFGRLRCISSGTSVKPYYVTTPIFYPNAEPHIGHLYSLVTADIFARFRRLSDPHTPVHFITGTDEHGMKIQQAAKTAGLEPSLFCDRLSKRFRDLTEQANISNTRFIRTSEPDHYAAAQEIWRGLSARGLIYKGKHSGWYSVSDECFYTENQITEVAPANNPQKTHYVSSETNSRVEWTQEENYMFKLSAFQQRLLDHLVQYPDFIYPPSRHQEMVEHLQVAPLEDLSISRLSSRLSWGIPVPDDPEHTIYVWFEALISYLTAVGYPWPESGITPWPSDLQILGKDIIRFHALYFPAMLMALEMPLPKQLLTHSHWTVDRKKMSKSVGNVVSPFDAMTQYGPDVVRFYLARVGGRFRHDIDWSHVQLLNHAGDIMSAVGNFYYRCTGKKMMELLLSSSEIPSIDTVNSSFLQGEDVAGKEILTELSGLREKVQEHLQKLEVADALEDILQVLATSNRVYTQMEPWKNAINPVLRAQMYTVSLEALRICGILLQPFIPTKSTELLNALGIAAEERTWAFAEIAKGRIGEVRQDMILFVNPRGSKHK